MLRKDFQEVAKEALLKLGLEWEDGSPVRNYNAGVTEQVPVHFIVRLKKRYRGLITDGNNQIIFEAGINAR